MQLKVKRVYEQPSSGDGQRVLVDRLWPRGLKKESAQLDAWLKDLAPSDALRKWFGHEAAKWTEFRRRYFEELEDQGEALDELRGLAAKGTVTLLYAAHDTEHNNAVALKDYLEKHRAKAQRAAHEDKARARR